MTPAPSIGRQRQQSHGTDPGATWYREDPLQAHLIGEWGEQAFATRYHLPLPTVNPSGRGDGGVDFRTPIGRISLKTFLRPKHLLLLPKEWPPTCRWYVLAEGHLDTKMATLLGWTTDTALQYFATTKDFRRGFGVQPRFPREHLCPMNHLAHGGLVDHQPDRPCCALHSAETS